MFAAAFVTGVVGSLHCLGMCAPLLVALNGRRKDALSFVIYHSGRLVTYAALGTASALVGASFSALGAQQWFSAALGAVVLMAGVSMLVFKKTNPIQKRISSGVVKLVSHLHASGLNAYALQFSLGFANGLLPCGLVYLAMAGAAIAGAPWQGAAYMLAFGAGTLPALFAATHLAASMNLRLRMNSEKMLTLAVLSMGALLLVRGLNLGIPYLSPAQPATPKAPIAICH